MKSVPDRLRKSKRLENKRFISRSFWRHLLSSLWSIYAYVMLYSVSTNCILIQKFRKNSACLCVVYFSESFAFRSVSVNTVVKPSPPPTYYYSFILWASFLLIIFIFFTIWCVFYILPMAHPASFPMGTRGSFSESKEAGAWSWPLTST
jgi:magnesium-transporting ATPase (P-type)